jgi:hypothetical protein
MCGGGSGRVGLGLASIVLTAAGAAVLAQGQILRDPRPYRSSIEITSINATVRNADGRLVSGLSREAFEVFEDGNPQEITQFTSERVPSARLCSTRATACSVAHRRARAAIGASCSICWTPTMSIS